ncbi:MAG: hypothetical protein R3B72_37340 [Polyangiaceae bacterium]
MSRSISSFRPSLVLGTLAAVLLGGACEYNRPAQPRYGYETYDQNCNNHLDDDYDGLIDCEDPDCVFTSGYCGLDVPDLPEGQEREDNFAKCTDSVDNDENGQFDCGDPNCQAQSEVCCYKETTNETCYDGIDNDQNGFADCGDFQCRNGKFITVCRERYDALTADEFPVCVDGIDNDGDGIFDCDESACRRDVRCSCQEGDDCFGNEDTLAACSDGKDNDADTRYDCADEQCSQNPDPAIVAHCNQAPEDSLLECSDGIDNNANGFIDCGDNDCRPQCNDCTMEDVPPCCSPQQLQLLQFCGGTGEAEVTLERCTDNIDNDGNGYTDCQDFSCDGSRAPSAEERNALIEYCDDTLERTYDKCTDGIDNDGNGYTDCGDFSCRNSNDPDVQIACQESVRIEAPWPHPDVTPDDHCSDGLDNDNDGYVDCDDWDCSWNPEVTVCQPPGKRVCE